LDADYEVKKEVNSKILAITDMKKTRKGNTEQN